MSLTDGAQMQYWSKGMRTTVRVTRRATMQDAWNEVLDMARRDGWTPPRWWEVWRWQEPRVPPDMLATYLAQQGAADWRRL